MGRPKSTPLQRRALNDTQSALQCVGWICPGFGTVEEMSADRLIEAINASGADFLVVALGARKGQIWLARNQKRLTIPVRAHLGATIHFEAGTLKRAPLPLQRLGLEWLWRLGKNRIFGAAMGTMVLLPSS